MKADKRVDKRADKRAEMKDVRKGRGTGCVWVGSRL